MKKKKHLNPFAALIIFILLFAFASTMEHDNIKEDKQAQIDARVTDSIDVPSEQQLYFLTNTK